MGINKRSSGLFAGIFMLLICAGCALTTPDLLYTEPTTGLGPDRVVLFGKVVLVENGVNQLPYETSMYLGNTPPLIEVKGVGGDGVWGKQTGNDGRFQMVVKRDRLRVRAVYYHKTPFEPQALIPALEGTEAFYVGTLVLDVETQKRMTGGVRLIKINKMEVLDEFEVEGREFQKRNQSFKKGIEKNLMAVDPTLPLENIPNLADDEDFEFWGYFLIRSLSPY